MIQQNIPNGLGCSLTNGIRPQDVTWRSGDRKDRKPLARQGRNLSRAVGWIGLMVSLSFVAPPDALALPVRTKEYCVCTCLAGKAIGGDFEIYVEPRGGNPATCKEFSGTECETKTGAIGTVKCDGTTRIAKAAFLFDERITVTDFQQAVLEALDRLLSGLTDLQNSLKGPQPSSKDKGR